MSHFLLAMLLALFQLFLTWQSVEAFDDHAHDALSEQATKVSGLDNFLKTQLGSEFASGTAEVIFNNQRVIQLIQQGAIDEDKPFWRVRHHFHNPRLAWNQAGWRPPPLFIEFGKSSILWGQDLNQGDGGKHSWKDARDTYFQALTATTDSERKSFYAETFKSLGHLIHLVQDAAAPSHTRNDTHISYKGVGDPDRFHGWAESKAALDSILGITPPALDPAFLNQPSPDSQAPVPIARLIDANAGDIGTDGLTPGLSLGIAEYSSANFYSDDTINSTNFLSPLPSQVEVRVPESDATDTKQRPYVFFKPGFGQQDYPLGLASALFPYVIDPLATPSENGLDTKVLSGYGAKLFPRAIGYSAGLIDYFFRGDIFASGCCIDTVADIINGRIHAWPTDGSTLALFDNSLTEELRNGSVQLVLGFGLDRDTTRYIVSAPIPVNLPPGGGTDALGFDFSSSPGIGTGAGCFLNSQCKMYVVYRGGLGKEDDAVIVGPLSLVD